MPVALSYSPAGAPKFAISTAAVMPNITVTASLSGVPVDPRSPPTYAFTATLAFVGSNTPHGSGHNTQHSAITPQTGSRNTYVIPFTQVRGGVLTVTVSVRVGTAAPITATSLGLTIVGSNPSPA